jgi:hypothetical protein
MQNKTQTALRAALWATNKHAHSILRNARYFVTMKQPNVHTRMWVWEKNKESNTVKKSLREDNIDLAEGPPDQFTPTPTLTNHRTSPTRQSPHHIVVTTA